MTQSKNKATSDHNMDPQTQKEAPGATGTSKEKVVGVDIGTSKIVFSEKKNGKIDFSSQRNAFISVEYSKFTEKILDQNQIKMYTKKQRKY